MSTKARHGPFRDEDGLNSPLFRSPAPGLRRVIWRDLHPLLFRSAGVVGIAGVIVAVIASGPHSEPAGIEITRESSQVPRIGADPAVSRPEAAASPAAERLAAFSVSSDAPTPPALVEAATAVQQNNAGTVPATNSRSAPPVLRTAPSAQATDAVVAAASQPQAAPAATARNAIRTALAASADPQAPAESGRSSLWAEEATKCPRDWLAPAGAEPASGSGSGCTAVTSQPEAEPQAAQPDPAGSNAVASNPAGSEMEAPAGRVAALATGSDGLGNTPLNLAVDALPADNSATEFFAPFPRARPEPPPNAVRTPARTRTAGRGKLGPPPDCGDKYARWRYVNKQPTWYCK